MRIFRAWTTIPKKAYFASLIRILKYSAFLIAVMLPGVFVSVANFTPELLPPELLYKVASAELATPLPLFMEALFVNFLLEIVREAGLRLPKPIGHSVSLVAALIVGDAAVSAGIVGTPVVIVAAMTAICTFVVPSLYEPITVLRILYIGRRPLGAFGYRYAAVLYAAGDVRYEFFRYPVYSAHRAGQQCILEGRPAAAQLAYAGAGRFFH